MGKALYRSYRSTSFDEVIGQAHITETLKNSLKNNTYAHAYLLTGPRGVGKTSVARIFAYQVNQASYPPDRPEVDIIEIDAASNRRIDEIRELRERVVIAPSRLKYKVYIIDEVHMLTKEAFNALLKTLEEPPQHAIFVLATTDVHKVPDTIVSRCLRFNFKPISPKDIFSHIQQIASREKIDITNEALMTIAEFSEGSFRDAIALVDQTRGHGDKVDNEQVKKLLGLGSEDLIDGLFSAAASRDYRRITELVDQSQVAGVSIRRLTGQLTEKFKSCMLSDDKKLSPKQCIEVIDGLIKIESYPDTKTALIVALAKPFLVTDENNFVSTGDVKNNDNLADNKKKEAPVMKTYSGQNDIITYRNHPDDALALTAPDEPAKFSKPDDWDSVLAAAKDSNKSLYAIARMARVEQDGDRLVVGFDFVFHQKQMIIQKNMALLRKIVAEKIPAIKEIDVILNKAKSAKNIQSIKNINNIFGGHEVLES